MFLCTRLNRPPSFLLHHSYLPGWKLKDPAATQDVCLRDMMSQYVYLVADLFGALFEEPLISTAVVQACLVMTISGPEVQTSHERS